MADRRPSLIDQMAMVAASQMFLEGLSDEEDISDCESSLGADLDVEDALVGDDDYEDTIEVFNTPLRATDGDDEEEEDEDEREAMEILVMKTDGGEDHHIERDDDDGHNTEEEIELLEHKYGEPNGSLIDHHHHPHHYNHNRYRHHHHGDDASHRSSAPSQVTSEEEETDEFGDNPMPLNYRWQQRIDSAEIDVDLVDNSGIPFNSSASELIDRVDGGLEYESSFTESEQQQTVRRPSFKQLGSKRRSSYQSNQSSSEKSANSAPARTTTSPSESSLPFDYEYGEGESGAGRSKTERRRPLSISVPNAAGATSAMTRRNSARRSSVNISKQALTAAAAGIAEETDSQASPSASTHSSSRPTGILGFNRRSTRRQNLSIQVRSGTMGSLDNAIESLRKQDSNSEWENVAAAVTVVAAGSAPAGSAKSRHIKFAVNDTVLVFLTLLNVTNMEDPKDTFTVAPVNKYGYPQGEGTTDLEKAGPYTFVLATVKYVHFDEDDRYYTVIRADTGTEQRADSGWMEPLSDPYGIDAASRAAKLTIRSSNDNDVEEEEEAGYFQNLMDNMIFIASWPAHFFNASLLPWYRHQRVRAKQRVTQLLYGESPFSCKVRVTGINLLVFCSFVFLFLEVINLGFLPGTVDDEMAIFGV